MKTDTPMKIPKGAITERKLRKLLKAETDKAGSSTAWANEHKIFPQTVSAFERQVQSAGVQIPEILGYKPALIYIPIDEPDLAIKPPSRAKAKPAGRTAHESLQSKPKEPKAKKPKKDKKKKKSK